MKQWYIGRKIRGGPIFCFLWSSSEFLVWDVTHRPSSNISFIPPKILDHQLLTCVHGSCSQNPSWYGLSRLLFSISLSGQHYILDKGVAEQEKPTSTHLFFHDLSWPPPLPAIHGNFPSHVIFFPTKLSTKSFATMLPTSVGRKGKGLENRKALGAFTEGFRNFFKNYALCKGLSISNGHYCHTKAAPQMEKILVSLGLISEMPSCSLTLLWTFFIKVRSRIWPIIIPTAKDVCSITPKDLMAQEPLVTLDDAADLARQNQIFGQGVLLSALFDRLLVTDIHPPACINLEAFMEQMEDQWPDDGAIEQDDDVYIP